MLKSNQLFYFLLLIILLFIKSISLDNNLLPNTNIDTNPKLIELKSSLNKFLSKFNSQSCLMEVLSTLSLECNQLSDESISKISYELTICSFKRIGKKHPHCSSSNINNCLKKFTGDIWTTYSTFTQHIDNLCFFYKSIIWEKSSEYIFLKLANSTMDILSDLKQSSTIAQELINSQEKISINLQSNITDAIERLNNVNELFDNYTFIESKLKEDLKEIEYKLRSNVILNHLEGMFEDKGIGMNSITFFMLYFGVLIVASVITGDKGGFLLCAICSVICEMYVMRIDWKNWGGFEVIYMRIGMIMIRGIFCIVAFAIFVYRMLYGNKKHCYMSRSKGEMSYSEIKGMLGMTPMWVRKYFSRVENQNDDLAEKLKKMMKSFQNEIDK